MSSSKFSRKVYILVAIFMLSFLVLAAGIGINLWITKPLGKITPGVDSDVLIGLFGLPASTSTPNIVDSVYTVSPSPGNKDKTSKKPTQVVTSESKQASKQLSDYRILISNAPEELFEGGVATFTWDISGPTAKIGHTAIHFGTSSTEGKLSEEVAPEETKYTDMTSDFTSGEFNIPLRFVESIDISSSGKYYFRAHAIVNNKNYWSEEYAFEVKPLVVESQDRKDKDYTIFLIYTPKEIAAGEIATFTWDIGGPATVINNTAIYYGIESSQGELSNDIVPKETSYTDLIKDFVGGKYNIPLRFVGNIRIITAGKYYFRGYAQINNKHYWTDEYSFEVVE